ncbi:MAG: AMP-binding protein [Anaerolineae bacterium]
MTDTLFGFFHRTVQRFPDRDYQRIKRGDSFHGVTYREAHQSVLEIGTGLMSFGVGKGDKVGLICDNRPEWILINLALQGIGSADVPRDSDVPLPELKAIVDDSKPRFVIVENEKVLQKVQAIMDTFPFVAAAFIIEGGSQRRKNVYTLDDVVAEGRAQLSQGNTDFLEAAQRVSPDDVCAIVYTSGTQGVPKGVILTHSNFAYQFEVVPPLWQLDENDRVLCLLPPWHLLERTVEYFVFVIGGSMSYTTTRDLLKDLALEKPTFIASVPRVWTALYERTLKQMRRQRHPLNDVLASLLEKALKYKKAVNIRNNRYPDASYDAGDRMKAFKDSAVHLVAYKLVDLLIFSKLRKALGGKLRGAVFGGGHLPEHVEDFLDAAGLNVLEAYGMTEAAPVLTARPFGGTLYTAGKPIPGTEIQILDRYLNPVEPGTQGVIYARGPQIMKGYTNQELTSRVLSPSSDGHPLKWYNTGDLGLITPSGDLKILGRARDDFKLLNGEWVTPQPIEDIIRTSEYIDDAMLVGADKKFVGALIFPQWDNVKRYARERNVDYRDDDPVAANLALAEQDQIKSLIEKEIGERVSEQQGIRPWQEVVRFAIIGEEPRIGAELTATLKIRRHFVREEYEEIIEELFS